MRKGITCLSLIIYGTSFCFAQSELSIAGGEATGAGGTMSYTIGQVAYTLNTNASGTVTQGVQQPFEIFVVTGLEEAIGINLAFSVYPNPTAGLLKLKIENYALENLSYQLYDVIGGLLQNGDIMDKETVIPTGELAPAAYYLRISDNQKELRTFKIIKN